MLLSIHYYLVCVFDLVIIIKAKGRNSPSSSSTAHSMCTCLGMCVINCCANAVHTNRVHKSNSKTGRFPILSPHWTVALLAACWSICRG